MAKRRQPVGVAAVIAAVTLMLGVHTVGSAVTADPPPKQALAARARPGSDTVIRVIDGESFDVRRGKETVRIRLLNVDAPEIAADGRPAACGAADATAWLTRRLSAGTPVTITYDSLQYDWYQRELGWVVTDDGKTVNVDLVRSGLAAAVSRKPNDAHGPEVAAAQKAAAGARAGYFAGKQKCALAARVKTQIAELDEAAERADRISRGSYEQSMRTIGRARAQTRSLEDELATATDTAEGRLLGRAAIGRLQRSLTDATIKADRIENRIVAAEEARIERELAAERARIRREAERREAAKRAAEEAEKAKNAPTAPASPGPTAPGQLTPSEPAASAPPAAKPAPAKTPPPKKAQAKPTPAEPKTAVTPKG